MNSLAIAIPAYKRPHLLDKCLESIIVQLDKNSDIAIWVFDDSCDDTNAGIIDKYQVKYENIIHIRNKSNLGICSNIHKAITDTIADYTWLCGEDDIFAYGSISKIRGIITANRPLFIYAEYSYVSNDYTTITKNKVLDYAFSGPIPAEKFYEECSWAMGFIGSCVFCRDVIKNGLSVDYLGTYFNHVWIVLRALREKDVYVTNEPMIMNRAAGGSSTTWADQTFKVYEGFYTVLDNLGAVYGHAARKRALATFDQKLGCFSLGNLLYCRFQGYFNGLSLSTIITSRLKFLDKVKIIVVRRLPRTSYEIIRSVIHALRLNRILLVMKAYFVGRS